MDFWKTWAVRILVPHRYPCSDKKQSYCHRCNLTSSLVVRSRSPNLFNRSPTDESELLRPEAILPRDNIIHQYCFVPAAESAGQTKLGKMFHQRLGTTDQFSTSESCCVDSYCCSCVVFCYCMRLNLARYSVIVNIGTYFCSGCHPK